MSEVISFPILTWENWQAKYRPDIRVHVCWDAIGEPVPVVTREWIFMPEDLKKKEVRYPWYEGGSSWRDGKNIRVREGSAGIVVVAPAVEVRANVWLLLDGCHRVRALRPKLLVLDALRLTRRQQRQFNDLIGEMIP